jgi:hypothetical protein
VTIIHGLGVGVSWVNPDNGQRTREKGKRENEEKDEVGK